MATKKTTKKKTAAKGSEEVRFQGWYEKSLKKGANKICKEIGKAGKRSSAKGILTKLTEAAGKVLIGAASGAAKGAVEGAARPAG
jgi:hypothetical protein